MNRVIIAGSRSINDYNLICSVIIESNFGINEVVCGLANGVDSLGKQWAIKNNIPIKEFPARWNDTQQKEYWPVLIKYNKNGKKYNAMAGFNRNQEMVVYASHLILIWDGKSPGSKHMLEVAQFHGLQIFEKIVK